MSLNHLSRWVAASRSHAVAPLTVALSVLISINNPYHIISQHIISPTCHIISQASLSSSMKPLSTLYCNYIAIHYSTTWLNRSTIIIISSHLIPSYYITSHHISSYRILSAWSDARHDCILGRSSCASYMQCTIKTLHYHHTMIQGITYVAIRRCFMRMMSRFGRDERTIRWSILNWFNTCDRLGMSTEWLHCTVLCCIVLYCFMMWYVILWYGIWY